MLHSAQKKPGYAFQADSMAREAAKEREIDRVYEEALAEHMSGDSETSYITQIIEEDREGLYQDWMRALTQSLSDEAEAGRQLRAIYRKAAERRAQQMTEQVA